MNAPLPQRVVHISSQSKAGTIVLVGDEYYEVSDRQLALLRAGMDPDDLFLEPLEDEEADDEFGIPHPDDLLREFHSKVL